MSYAVKELFFTLQGEGANAGRAAVFCRFAGCNLWTGREADRQRAQCTYCDTDFVGTNGIGGGRFETAADLADAMRATWKGGDSISPFIVCTGGEPLLQLDESLVLEMHKRGMVIAVETNGTVAAPSDLDWICVSPKPNVPLVLRQGNELKVVYPQDGLDPSELEHLEFAHFFLQPMDSPDRAANTAGAVRYCLDHPKWRLSLQTHKYLGIP